MKKTLIYVGLGILVIAVLLSIGKVMKSNKKPKKTYKTEQLEKRNIINKVVATGKIIPEEEIEIKPQISGIISKILVEEGAQVKKGDLIAKVKVVPSEQSLNSARGQLNKIKIRLNNAKISYDRNKKLYDRGVIAKNDFEKIELTYNQAKQDLNNALNDLQIIKKGYVGSGGAANTNIRATVSGTVLEIPVEEGDQVIQSNNFNAGTTIATIADMDKMIFEGKVDEAEVGKLKENMDLDIVVGALEDEKFKAKLGFIAVKGKEENGAIQFKVEGDLKKKPNSNIRANYSANATIIIEKRDSVPAIREALLQYDKETKKPFVEVVKGENEFEKRDVKLGVSDDIYVEVLDGVTMEDKIKVWNKEQKNENKKGKNEN
ncbi:MAG TPA: efflux RND transporter periplasmic adaptor subunit [Flavobacteriia bacterium]|nr:efflux RND transporter periplasmic adaptor subunit [Flavobacteriia bacterium]